MTTCDRVALLDARLLASPPYEATMLCVPTDSVLVVHAAVLLLPLPASATALQPAIEAPPSLKLTLPVGAMPTTVAVKVTLAPNVDGFIELATVVVLVALLTTCESAALLDALLPASPLYAATRLCVPAANALVAHCAVRVLPEPLSATAPQPATVLPRIGEIHRAGRRSAGDACGERDARTQRRRVRRARQRRRRRAARSDAQR